MSSSDWTKRDGASDEERDVRESVSTELGTEWLSAGAGSICRVGNSGCREGRESGEGISNSIVILGADSGEGSRGIVSVGSVGEEVLESTEITVIHAVRGILTSQSPSLDRNCP